MKSKIKVRDRTLAPESKGEAATRRRFLTGAVGAAAGGVALVAAPNVSRAAPVTLKVQAAWGGGIFLEFAQDYVTRVNEMAGDSLKIDLLGVGAVRAVPASIVPVPRLCACKPLNSAAISAYQVWTSTLSWRSSARRLRTAIVVSCQAAIAPATSCSSSKPPAGYEVHRPATSWSIAERSRPRPASDRSAGRSGVVAPMRAPSLQL